MPFSIKHAYRYPGIVSASPQLYNRFMQSLNTNNWNSTLFTERKVTPLVGLQRHPAMNFERGPQLLAGTLLLAKSSNYILTVRHW